MNDAISWAAVVMGAVSMIGTTIATVSNNITKRQMERDRLQFNGELAVMRLQLDDCRGKHEESEGDRAEMRERLEASERDRAEMRERLEASERDRAEMRRMLETAERRAADASREVAALKVEFRG